MGVRWSCKSRTAAGCSKGSSDQHCGEAVKELHGSERNAGRRANAPGRKRRVGEEGRPVPTVRPELRTRVGLFTWCPDWD